MAREFREFRGLVRALAEIGNRVKRAKVRAERKAYRRDLKMRLARVDAPVRASLSHLAMF